MGAVWATREARAARRSARARRASDMDAMVGGEWGSGRRIPAHPYLACQMSDFGFRQTLEVRALGCARRLRLLPTCAPPPRKDLSYGKHKRHRVYTGSGHRCCVIPYSSVVWWIASWADDDKQYKEEQPREGLFLAGGMNC